jgi:ABC-type microcin C transport system permease subunit YejE
MSKILRARHFLLLTLLSFSLCTNLCAQEKTITANFKNATLKQVFNSIEKQTSYRFSYRNAVIDNRRDITISMSHASVVSVLNEALRNRNLEYVIISSRSIVISDKQKSMIDQRHTGVNQKVSGVVKDASGEPIIGASVIEKRSFE